MANSVHMFVRDCAGVQYLDTFADNTPEQIAQFRKHAEWWKRYVCTQDGRKAYGKTAKGLPGFPVEIVIEEYQDKSQF